MNEAVLKNHGGGKAARKEDGQITGGKSPVKSGD
jgi:hypothetical protein